jgi:electron transfer flavoprotein alpha subunit
LASISNTVVAGGKTLERSSRSKAVVRLARIQATVGLTDAIAETGWLEARADPAPLGP